MPDLVGVVIPAYIGALSSLAGVIVAIVALVTARRARTDARQAADATARVGERERTTRDAVAELAVLTREGLSQPRSASPAATAATGPITTATGGLGSRLGGSSLGAPGSRPRHPSSTTKTGGIEDAVARRPHWARPDRARTGERESATDEPAASVDRGPSPRDAQALADRSDRLDALVRRLQDDPDA